MLEILPNYTLLAFSSQALALAILPERGFVIPDRSGIGKNGSDFPVAIEGIRSEIRAPDKKERAVDEDGLGMQLGLLHAVCRNVRGEFREIGGAFGKADADGDAPASGSGEFPKEFRVGKGRSPYFQGFFGASDETDDFRPGVEGREVRPPGDRSGKRTRSEIGRKEGTEKRRRSNIVSENEKFPIFPKRGGGVVSRGKNVGRTVDDGIFGMHEREGLPALEHVDPRGRQAVGRFPIGSGKAVRILLEDNPDVDSPFFRGHELVDDGFFREKVDVYENFGARVPIRPDEAVENGGIRTGKHGFAGLGIGIRNGSRKRSRRPGQSGGGGTDCRRVGSGRIFQRGPDLWWDRLRYGLAMGEIVGIPGRREKRGGDQCDGKGRQDAPAPRGIRKR